MSIKILVAPDSTYKKLLAQYLKDMLTMHKCLIFLNCRFKDEFNQILGGPFVTYVHISTLQKSDMKQFLKNSRVISLLLSRKKCK